MSLIPLSGPSVALMESLRAERVTQADAQLAIDQFLTACAPLTKEERQIQFDQLLSLVDESAPGPACFLSVVCGALLEQGAWSGRMGEVVHRLLDGILPQAAYLAREWQKREDHENQSRPATFGSLAEEDADEELRDKVTAETFEEISRAHPSARDAWDLLNTVWPACVALYSVDVPARVRARMFIPILQPLIDRHEGAYWLGKLLPVLDHEPLIVIDPEREVGITGVMSGVADNFQLQTLLMDVFPRRWFERRRITPTAISVATGAGPQQSNEMITGQWNLYTGQALDHRGQLPSVSSNDSRHWIWGEGVPTDIPVINGSRVVLLGPPSYSRSWPSVRLFRRLKASLTDIKVMQTTAIRDWKRQLSNTSAE